MATSKRKTAVKKKTATTKSAAKKKSAVKRRTSVKRNSKARQRALDTAVMAGADMGILPPSAPELAPQKTVARKIVQKKPVAKKKSLAQRIRGFVEKQLG